jgi:transposase-like protein
MDAAEADVLAFMTFPKELRAKLHSTNPLERLNKMGYPAGRVRAMDHGSLA